MTSLIEYDTNSGSIAEIKDRHREVYNAAKTTNFNGEQIIWPESDYSAAPALVQAAFVAVKDLAERSDGKAVFSPQTATIRYGSDTITPETDVSAYPADIQAFVQAIYTFNNNEQTKIWNALQVEVIEPDRHPEPLTPEQEKELARRQIIQDFDNGVKALTSGYTESEVKSWDAKQIESKIILSGSEEPTPIIDAIVEGLSVDRNQFAKLIEQKAKQYGAAYGKLEAKMKRDLAALEE